MPPNSFKNICRRTEATRCGYQATPDANRSHQMQTASPDAIGPRETRRKHMLTETIESRRQMQTKAIRSNIYKQRPHDQEDRPQDAWSHQMQTAANRAKGHHMDQEDTRCKTKRPPDVNWPLDQRGHQMQKIYLNLFLSHLLHLHLYYSQKWSIWVSWVWHVRRSEEWEFHFTAITPRSTLNWSDSTY